MIAKHNEIFSRVFLLFVLNHSKTLCKSPMLNWFTSSSLKCFIVVQIFIFLTLYYVLKQNKIKFFFHFLIEFKNNETEGESPSAAGKWLKLF